MASPRLVRTPVYSKLAVIDPKVTAAILAIWKIMRKNSQQLMVLRSHTARLPRAQEPKRKILFCYVFNPQMQRGSKKTQGYLKKPEIEAKV